MEKKWGVRQLKFFCQKVFLELSQPRPTNIILQSLIQERKKVLEECLSGIGDSLTEEEIESVVQDMEQCSEDDIKKIVKFTQDFKKKPRFHYRNPPTPDHYYHCEICHNPMPELPKSTIIISYQCTDPKVSIRDLKIMLLCRKISPAYIHHLIMVNILP